MGKNGQLLSYKAIFVLIVSSLLIYVFILAGKSFGSQEAPYKNALAKEIALTIDTIYSIPGDIIFIYPNQISGYTIEIKDNSVLVYKGNNKLDPTIQSYAFHRISSDNPDFIISSHKYLTIQKKNNQLKITGLET